jgi:hypothetical protein
LLEIREDGASYPHGYVPLVGKDWSDGVVGEPYEARNLLTSRARISYLMSELPSSVICTDAPIGSIQAVIRNGEVLPESGYTVGSTRTTVTVKDSSAGDRITLYFTYRDSTDGVSDLMSCTHAEVFGGAFGSRPFLWGGEDGTLVVKSGENVFTPIYTEATHINGKKANMSLTTGMIFNLYLPLPGAGVKAGSVYSPDAIGPVETVKVEGVDMLKLSFVSELEDFAATTVTICFTADDGEELTYEVNINALQYVTLLANTYICGTEEAQLAYEIVSYKKAVATYLATAEGKTLAEVLTEAELSAISSFEAVFAAHAAGCACTAGLYSDAEVGTEVLPTGTYTNVGISGFAYLLNSDNNGLRINVGENTVIKYASYNDLLGVEVVHDEALGNLKLIETETDRYYVISGISASDTTATFTITVEYNGVKSTVTYSLAQYINSTGADVAKALYSYSKAAAAYKAITASEKQ